MLIKLPLVIGGILTILSGIIVANAKDIWHWLFSKGIYQRPAVGSIQPATFAVDGTITIPPQQLPDSIGAFNEPLTDPDEFFGRKSEYDKIVGRIRKGASSSIIGPRRIGKSWLLSYLKLTIPAKLGAESVHQYQMGYLDATLPSCSTVHGFMNKVLEELGVSPQTRSTQLGLLEEVVRELKAKNTVPVLCIDEFEGLTRHSVFDYDFITHLRAISQLGLVLVIASKSPPITLVSNATRGSKFFNTFREFTLKPFTKIEAQRFIQAKARQAGFTQEEQTFLLEHTLENNQWQPVCLQVAAELLLEDKKQAQYNPDSYRPTIWEYRDRFRQRLEQEYAAAMEE